MGELNAHRRAAVAVAKRDHMAQRFFVVVRIQADTILCDTTARLNRGGFRDGQPQPRERITAQMHHMPVRRVAFPRAVLTHGRQNNAVGQGDATHRNGLEELACHSGGPLEFRLGKF